LAQGGTDVARKLYNCLKCPAYCCSYDRIIVSDADIRRLGNHFGLTEAQARKKFTKKGTEKGEKILRHKKDEHFGTICQFVDPDTRRCTIYSARPRICREFPGDGRCGYYDFLSFERKTQEDPEYVSTTN
jgi:Fe-S-cluster containining protein